MTDPARAHLTGARRALERNDAEALWRHLNGLLATIHRRPARKSLARRRGRMLDDART